MMNHAETPRSGKIFVRGPEYFCPLDSLTAADYPSLGEEAGVVAIGAHATTSNQCVVAILLWQRVKYRSGRRLDAQVS